MFSEDKPLITSTRTSNLIILGEMFGTSYSKISELAEMKKGAQTVIFEAVLSIADIRSCSR